MVSVRLTGTITRDGKLEITLPDDLPPGEVQVVIELPTPEPRWEDQPWTQGEIRELLRIEPKSGAQIVANLGEGWEGLGIPSGAEWVEEQRRKRRERRKW